MKVRHSGQWKDADPYVRNNGIWKPTTVSFKHNDKWNELSYKTSTHIVEVGDFYDGFIVGYSLYRKVGKFDPDVHKKLDGRIESFNYDRGLDTTYFNVRNSFDDKGKKLTIEFNGVTRSFIYSDGMFSERSDCFNLNKVKNQKLKFKFTVE